MTTSSQRAVQIPLLGARTRPSRPLLAHRRAGGLLTRVHRCLVLFPELDTARIRVGITRSADGLAVLDEMTVRFDLRRRLPTHYTIGHELTHLLQALGLVPHGEIQCDIWTVSRHSVLRDEEPCYLPLPQPLRDDWTRHRDRVGELCARAIEYRTRRRTYIRWLRARLEELAVHAEQ